MIKHKMAKLGISFIVVSFLIAGCTGVNASSGEAKKVSEVKPMFSAEDIGLRKTSVYEEDKATAVATDYSEHIPGSGVKIQRAYQDAPPMIPHDVEGMMEITRDNNQCISCHIPAVAESMGATPIPNSHFIDFRPRHKLVGDEFKKVADNMKNEVSIKKLDDLSSARFNCAACHAPQSQSDPLVANVFQPDFLDKDGTDKSNWDGDRLLEGLNTLAD